MKEDWRNDLEIWLTPFLSALRHKTRARMCPAYIAGLIGPGDRKSVQPMAARAGDASYDQLYHFVASGVWDAASLEARLLAEADRIVGRDDAWLITPGSIGPVCRTIAGITGPSPRSRWPRLTGSTPLGFASVACWRTLVMG